MHECECECVRSYTNDSERSVVFQLSHSWNSWQITFVKTHGGPGTVKVPCDLTASWLGCLHFGLHGSSMTGG